METMLTNSKEVLHKMSSTILQLPGDLICAVVTMISASDALELEAVCKDMRYSEGLSKAWPAIFSALKISAPVFSFGSSPRQHAIHILKNLGLQNAMVGPPSTVSFSTSELREPPLSSLFSKTLIVGEVDNVPPFPLQFKDTGESVAQLNRYLTALGFLPQSPALGPAFSKETRDAVVAFQFRHLHTFDHTMTDCLGHYGSETAAALAREYKALRAADTAGGGAEGEGGGGGGGGGFRTALKAKVRRDAAAGLQLTWNEGMTQALDLRTTTGSSSSHTTSTGGDDDDLPTARVIVMGGPMAGATSLVDAFLGKKFDPQRSARSRNDMRVIKSAVTFRHCQTTQATDTAPPPSRPPQTGCAAESAAAVAAVKTAAEAEAEAAAEASVASKRELLKPSPSEKEKEEEDEGSGGPLAALSVATPVVVGVGVDITEKRSSARRTPFAWKLYAGSSAAVLVCFDVTQRQSLEVDAKACLAEIRSHAHSRLVSDQLPVFLVGCKADNNRSATAATLRAAQAASTTTLPTTTTTTSSSSRPQEDDDEDDDVREDVREVSFEEGAAFANERGLVYIETSARDHIFNSRGTNDNATTTRGGGHGGGVDAPFLLAARAVAANSGWLPLSPATERKIRLCNAALRLKQAAFYSRPATGSGGSGAGVRNTTQVN